MGFVESYGPWAVIAGASDGVGATFAREVACRGVNVVLLARRQGVLDDVAASIRAEGRVEARAVAVDLAAPDAMARVRAATDGLEVGFLVYCAGADPSYQPLLANPVETATTMIQRNCTVPLAMCHHFAGPMVTRRRGGIVILGSAAGFFGAPNMVAYAASKAFDMVLAEALWAELREHGVDVLGLILGETDTPALRRLRRSLGHDDDPEAPRASAATPEQVVAEAFDNLANGPTWIVGESLRQAMGYLAGMSRRDGVELMIQAGAATMRPAVPRK
jgi:short-subunit dehydrogenase